MLWGHFDGLDHDHSDAIKLNPSKASTPLIFSQEVKEALATKKPVVALESTIISHGMPYPKNLQTAREVEQVVRHHGAIPATIAIISGVPHIGLTENQLVHIAKAGSATVRKTSRRDLPHVLAMGLDGATTVSATMLLAARAGISVFVTGGIGGVHRGAEFTMDVSADLTELGKTPVAVVCAGVKSILDIPRTLEYLETQGVCVASYGADNFPAFFMPDSGCKAPCRFDTPLQAAAAIRVSQELSLDSGMIIAVPVPAHHAAAGREIETAIHRALKDAETQGVAGNEITPYLLERIRSLTGDTSLETNIALVKNNAKIGAQIAVALYGS